MSLHCARNHPPRLTRRFCSTGSTRCDQAGGSFPWRKGRSRGSCAEIMKLDTTAVPRNTKVSGSVTMIWEAAPRTRETAPSARAEPLENSWEMLSSSPGRSRSGAPWARWYSQPWTRSAVWSRPSTIPGSPAARWSTSCRANRPNRYKRPRSSRYTPPMAVPAASPRGNFARRDRNLARGSAIQATARPTRNGRARGSR